MIVIYQLTDDQKKLAEENIKLAYWRANEWAKRLNRINCLGEIKGRCMVGLVKSAKSFDPSKSKFATYSTRCMDNEVRMWLRKNQKRSGTINFSGIHLADDEGNELPIECIVEELQIDAEENSLVDSMWLQSCIFELKPLEVTVLYLYYYKDLSQKDVAERIGYTQSYVSRLMKKALIRLHKIYFERENNLKKATL